MLGLYLHIPFCMSKCPYCDFYSLVGCGDDEKNRYLTTLTAMLYKWAETLNMPADTIYLGGGTPTLLGAKRLEQLITNARTAFCVPDHAEITLEANPGDDLHEVLSAFRFVGGNRLSLGVQAVDDEKLQLLGRRHSVQQAEQTARLAHRLGLDNLSFDLMLATSEQTISDVQQAARRFADWGATHISAYLLKIEPNTPYALSCPPLPDDDQAATLYLEAVQSFAKHGYAQYEISNFAKPGYESRHNLKYWNSDPYIGIGPSAHSFVDGRRFFYPRSLSAFYDGQDPLAETTSDIDIPENSPAEYAMLRLRLTEGLTEHGFFSRFGQPIPTEWRKRAARIPPHLLIADEKGMRLTAAGFLVSDVILSRLL